MHLVVIFYNLGGYHVARLRETKILCQQQGWNFTAIEVTDRTLDRPWGSVKELISFSLETLLPTATTPENCDCSPFSEVAASLIGDRLSRLKPDTVAIPGWGFPVSRAALNWCQQNDVPAILMSESKWDDCPRSWWKELLKSRLYIKKYSAALVGGQLHKDYLVRLGFPSNKVFLGYDVVDNDFFTTETLFARQNIVEVRKREPKIPLKPYFLTANRLIPRKNIARLIEAYNIYCQQVGKDNAWDLVICGSGEELNHLQQIVDEFQIHDRVHFPGFITYNRTIDWYALASAFVHPALQEQWGLVINEACAARLPILASNTVGAAYELVVAGENGWLFSPEDTQQIANVLGQCHHLDPLSLQKMGISSHELVSKFHPQLFAKSLFAAIECTLFTKAR